MSDTIRCQGRGYPPAEYPATPDKATTGIEPVVAGPDGSIGFLTPEGGPHAV